MKTLAIITWLSSCALDTYSSSYALNHGAREIWLTQSKLMNTAIISAQCGLIEFTTEKIRLKHPKFANSLLTSLGAMKITISSHNIMIIREIRKN